MAAICRVGTLDKHIKKYENERILLAQVMEFTPKNRKPAVLPYGEGCTDDDVLIGKPVPCSSFTVLHAYMTKSGTRPGTLFNGKPLT